MIARPNANAIGMVICDLDGTLLNQEKRISDKTVDIVQQIKEKVPFIIATARAPRDVQIYLSQLGLTTPCIYYNGALIADENAGQPIYTRSVEASHVHQLLNKLKRMDGIENCVVERNDQYWTYVIDDEIRMNWMMGGILPHSTGYPSTFLNEDATKIMIRGKHDEIVPVIEREFSDNVNYTYSDSRKIWLEVMHKQVSKSIAVQYIAQKFGVKLQQIMAFGDSYNDEEMIRIAGVGVAMGNAHPSLKKSADVIAPANNEDGVAVVLENLLLKRGDHP